MNEIREILEDEEAKQESSLARVGSIVGACNARLGSPLHAADLEEVTQEVSLSVWSKRDSFRGDSDIETWIFAIARNSILEMLRRRHIKGSIESEWNDAVPVPVDPSAGPATNADTGVARVIEQELSEAGTTVRKICRWRAIDGRTFGEIGEALQSSEAQVKARFYRSLPALQRRLRALWTGSID